MILSAFLTLGGCHYLDIDEDTTSLTEEKVFSTFSGAKAYLDKVFQVTEPSGGKYGTNYIITTYPQNLDKIYMYGGSWATQTDIADAAAYACAAISEFKRCNLSETTIQRFTYYPSATTGGYCGISTSMFNCIRIANKSIENFSMMVDGTEKERNEHLGKAYFLRGYCHFVLCEYFGGVPYLDHSLKADDAWDIARGTSYDTYVKAAEDLYKAYGYLKDAGYVRRNSPSVLNPGEAELNRPSGCICLALRARALMYAASPLNNTEGEKAWKNAAEACAEALSVALEQKYDLQPMLNYTDLFYGYVTTNETLWANVSKQMNSETVMTTIIPQILSNGTASLAGKGTNPTQNFVDRFETLEGYALNTEELRNVAITAGCYNDQNPYSNRDPRLAYNVIYDGALPIAKDAITSSGGCYNLYFNKTTGQYPRTTLNNLDLQLIYDWNTREQDLNGYSSTGYYARKFYDGSFKTDHYVVDPMIRLAELYLNYAECVNEVDGPSGTAGNVSLSALDAVNTVRSRAGMPDVRPEYCGSKDSFRERIWNERIVELAFEANHYWFDMRRWKLAPKAMTSTLYGMYVESCPMDAEHPLGKKFERRPLAANHQGVWKDCMYVLPFSYEEEKTMSLFKNNAAWK